MKKVISILIIAAVLGISFFIVDNVPSIGDGTAVIMHDDFILSFLGVLAGFAIAIITFLFANLDQIRKSILANPKLNEHTKANVRRSITYIYSELKQDTLCMVIFLPVCLLLIIVRDCPEITFKINNISNYQIISSIELSILLLTFIALLDIVISLFNLAKVSNQDFEEDD